MTCIKTGCTVFFENYGYQVRADLYRVDTTVVIRWTLGSIEFPKEQTEPTADYVVKYWDGEEVWHRDDLGVSVVPNDYFRFN